MWGFEEAGDEEGGQISASSSDGEVDINADWEAVSISYSLLVIRCLPSFAKQQSSLTFVRWAISQLIRRMRVISSEPVRLPLFPRGASTIQSTVLLASSVASPHFGKLSRGANDQQFI